MSKKKTMNQPVKCIVYLSTVGDLQHVNQREQRQMNYISDYAKGNNIEIVKVMRRNVLGQLDVNRHFDQLVQMISEGFADGILIANMQFVSKDIDDACRKIPNCPFVLYVGKKKLIKRAEFERYLLENIEI